LAGSFVITCMTRQTRPYEFRRVSPCLLRFLVVGLISVFNARAAEAVRLAFDLPADAAEKSLKRFSEQARREVLFASHITRGVRANAVKGEFSARDAINSLLANTGLIAVHDEKTGAFSVRNETRDEQQSRPADAKRPPSGHPREPVRKNPTQTPQTPMKKNNLLSRVTASVGLLLSPAVLAAESGRAGAPDQRIQDQNAGEITGRVSNEALGVFLEGARVELVGSNRWVLTDREGRFRIPAVPPGTATLEVSYIGLNPQEVVVDLAAGQSLHREIALNADIYVMDRFTVAGIREGQALAITHQRNAPNIKNVMATDAFGNIADGNAAEALRLLPGVSAIVNENEGRFIMVRGIDANLNSVTFDGMRMGSGGASDNRQVGISEIPLGAIEFMEVTKSPTPDMDGDSIGGSINLRPANVFDRANPRRTTFAASASVRRVGRDGSFTNYTSNRVRPTLHFGYSDVIGSKKNIGIALNLSHTINWIPEGGLIFATYEQTADSPAYMRIFNHYDYHSKDRIRSGGNLRLDYKVSENSRLYFNGFYTRFSNKQGHEGGNTSITGLAQIATLDASGRPIPFQAQFPFGHPSYRAGGFNAAGNLVQASILPGYTDEVTEMMNATFQFASAPVTSVTKRYTFQPGGHHRFGDFEIDYTGIYEESPGWSGQKDRRRDLIRTYNVQVPNTAWRLDSTRHDTLIRRDVTQKGGPDVRDPQNWTLGGLNSTVTERKSSIYGGQVNLKRSYTLPVPVYLKTGLKFMSEKRTTSNPNETFTYTGPQALIGTLVNTKLPREVPAGEWHPYGFVPPYLDPGKINQLRAEHPEYFVANPATSLQNALQNDKSAKEQVLAGYMMGNVMLGRLSMLGGVRVEKTDARGTSAVQDPAAANGIVDPVQRIQAMWGRRVSVKRDYTNVLPGLHIKYEPRRDLVMRSSYSVSVGRPSFGSIYPDTRINYDTQRITQNNPGLKPQVADNFDLGIERYFEPVGLVSAGVFLKEIRQFLFSTVITIPTGNDNGFDGQYAGWELSTQDNGGRGRVRGAELNYSQQLSFLPRAWSGFGIFANYTYLETIGDYGRVNEPAGSALANFTPRVASGGLSYSRGKFTGRLNANYTGTYMRGYNANPLLRMYIKSRTMWNLKLAHGYGDHLTFFLDVDNIFYSKMTLYRGPNRNHIVDENADNVGARIQFGVRGNF
jgi:iron complex outermembrane recepter protein